MKLAQTYHLIAFASVKFYCLITLINYIEQLLHPGLQVLLLSSSSVYFLYTLSVKISSVKSDEIFEKFCHF